MKKILWLIVLCMLMVAVMSACGGNNSNNGNAEQTKANAESSNTSSETAKPVEEKPKSPITLTMTVWGDEARVALYSGMAEEYKKTNPHVSVDVQAIPFADYQQKLSIMVASNTAPDIAWLAERMVPQFLANGQLANIADSVKNDLEYDFADIIPSTLQNFESNGGLYGIPFSTPPQVIFYNKTLFEKNNQKTPMELYQEGNWTYEQFEKAAAALSDPNNGVFGSMLGTNTKLWSDYLFGLVWAMGGDVFDEKLTQFKMNSPEAIKALNYYKNLIDTRSHPSIGSQVTFDGGKLAMSLENVTNTSKYRDKVDFEWDIAPMPAGDGGLVIPLGLAGYSVFATERQEEATQFLKFLTNKENGAIIAKNFVPQRQSILYSDAYLNAFAHPAPETLKIAAYDLMDQGRIRPGHMDWVNIDEQISINFDAFLAGVIPAEEAVKKMEEAVTPLLK